MRKILVCRHLGINKALSKCGKCGKVEIFYCSIYLLCKKCCLSEWCPSRRNNSLSSEIDKSLDLENPSWR